MRRPKATAAGAVRSARPRAEGFNISNRPAEAADRAVPGHWEGDLLLGVRGASAIVTLVERSSRFVMLGHLPDTRDSSSVMSIMSTRAERLPAQLVRSLTWDCGTEMAKHRTFTVASNCPVYFADPHSPWQRGSNENTNGLLRQYFPRSRTDFKLTTRQQLDEVAAELNDRPEPLNGVSTRGPARTGARARPQPGRRPKATICAERKFSSSGLPCSQTVRRRSRQAVSANVCPRG